MAQLQAVQPTDGLSQFFLHAARLKLGRPIPVATRPRPRRDSGRDDVFYAVIARDYLDVLARGSRRPIHDLARARKLKASTVRDMVHEARERALLSKSKAGIRGGQMLPRCIELLESLDRKDAR
jgi:hypothetical protein